jgi:hypothetical protein
MRAVVSLFTLRHSLWVSVGDRVRESVGVMKKRDGVGVIKRERERERESGM